MCCLVCPLGGGLGCSRGSALLLYPARRKAPAIIIRDRYSAVGNVRETLMNEQTLGKLEKLDLRQAWESEAGDFTPWLAQEDNLALLGKTLRIELELVAQEQNVGPFRADIVCLDTADRNMVLIENQLERTDHSHLGQLMTYAAGLEAVTVVWIAERFTEEHRAALDWLNRITVDLVNFFGLEVELWRISDSPPAPKFNLVAKPNEWTKLATSPRGPLTETQQLYLEYWTALREHLEAHQSPRPIGRPSTQMWMDFSMGRSDYGLAVVISKQKKCMDVRLIILDPDRLAHFNLLRAQEKEIEQELGPALEWEERPDKTQSQIRRSFENTDPTDRADWPRQHETIQRTLEAFHSVFAPRIENLNATRKQPEAEA